MRRCRLSSLLAVAALLAVLLLGMPHTELGGFSSMLAPEPEELVLGASAFGVQRYSIPGDLGSGTNCSLPGTLHVYLKALRWPVGWLRVRGVLGITLPLTGSSMCEHCCRWTTGRCTCC